MPVEGSADLTDSTSNIIGNIINTNIDDNINRNTIIEMAEIL
jgi:ACT domain-containing protein